MPDIKKPFYDQEAINELAKLMPDIEPELRLMLIKVTSGLKAEGVDMGSCLAGLMLAYTIVDGLLDKNPLIKLLSFPMTITPLLQAAVAIAEELRGPNP